MNDTKEHSAGVTRHSAIRISTDETQLSVHREECVIAVERPVSLEVDNIGTFTIMTSPGDRRALAVGFLFSEGVIDGMQHIDLLEECSDSPDVIRVRLSKNAPGTAGKERNMLIVSSCGFCGAEDLEQRLNALSKVGDNLRLGGRMLRLVAGTMREGQPLFKECGGTHAAGIFLPAGESLAIAEDIGRHNALDKAIGKCMLSDRSPEGCLVMLSGRVSLEMIVKCARAGIELISAVSAPTSFAIQAAEQCRITLCAFVRDTRATVFTHPYRIEDIEV
jgi:FdhD protein